MRLTLLLSAMAALAGLSSCGMLSDEDSNDGSSLIKEDGKGCVQGVVLNGITGERLDLKSSNGKEGVHVIVRNKLLRAKTHVNGESESAFQGLKGEYYACGIPLDAEFPIVAWKDGFQSFEGRVMVPSTIAQRTTTSEMADNELEYPNVLADIYLYPKGTEAHDLLFTIVKHGDIVQGAQVQLKATGSNSLHPSRALDPQVRSVPAIQTTDKNGQVKFSGKELVLGGVYEYTIIPPNGGESISFKKGTVVVGLRSEGTGLSEVKPYEIVVPVGDTAAKLTPVAQSTDAADYNKEGKVVIWFNQPIELTPGSSDAYSASLTGATKAELFAEGTTDSLKLKIDGNRLTLTPVWKSGLKPKADTDENATITYNGIVLRPVGDSRSENYYSVPVVSIRIFDR